MTDYNLKGYRPEDVKPEHWTNDRIRDRMKATLNRDTFDLGSVDLREFSSPRHNQYNLGSCVAQSVVKALEIKRIAKYGHEKHVDLSVLALYYLARELMDPPETHVDDGTYISHACDALRRWGICEESLWPYAIPKYHVAPPWKAMRRGYVNKIDSFYRITGQGEARIADVLIHLHAGNPVVFGTKVTDQWYGYDGDKPFGPVNGEIHGGHATVLVGWDADKGVFIGENSWGVGWGDGGFYYATPEFVKDSFARDFWAIAAGWEDWL